MARRPCPICGEPATLALRPFCSSRCANVDLQRWLTGGYRLDAEDEDRRDGRAEAVDERDAEG